MASRRPAWRPGRGKLGPLAPLLGRWKATGASTGGDYRVERTLASAVGGALILMTARWEIAGRPPYEEHALFGVRADGSLGFWSFTSEGKRSEGWRADAPDLPPGAIAFEADMPAGRARQAFWPPDEGGEGFCWAVESRNRKGWNRFVEHRYRPG